MFQTCLLFGVLALAGGQLIYPDEYRKMIELGRGSSLPADYSTLEAASYSQPDQQFSNKEPASAFTAAGGPSYSTTARVPLSAYPIASPQPMPETWGEHVNKIISRGITKFALDLDRAIYKTSGTSLNNRRQNVIFSPLSISITLSLVLLGSAGKTFDEASRILGLETGVDISQHSEIVHLMFGQLLAVMNYRVEGTNMPQVNSASGIFVQQGYPIRTAFRSISENSYNSEVINLDFRTKGREARDTINAWVKQRTMEKIDSILNDRPDPLTTVILVSALYFKGEWNQHFMGSMTRRKQFFIEPNDTVEIDMMYNGGNFPFYEDKTLGVKILALPYKGLETSMYVLLPRAEGATALKNFQDQLTAQTIDELIDNMKNDTCIIGFPRMKLSSTINLNEPLHNLGLDSLFDPRTADLSLLSYGYGQAPLEPVVPIPQGQPAPIPQALPTSIPQESLPKTRQIPLAQLPSPNTGDVLIFSRAGNDNSARKNYFTYSDEIRGINVKQWNNGFYIQKTDRPRRELGDYGKQRNDKSSRAAYLMENDDLEKIAPEVGHKGVKYVSLEENKYRFQNTEKNSRGKRQSRPIDPNFLRFMQTQNIPNYGLDDLRNSANLVNPGLYANEVLHKVEMDVTEKGTEAAATTAVLLRRDGNQKKLVANRPFMFFIRHDPTKLILFWGTVNVPTPNYAVVR